MGSCLGARSFGVVFGVLGRSTNLGVVGTTTRGRLVFRGLVGTCGRDLNGFTTAFFSTNAFTADPWATRVGLGTSWVLAAESWGLFWISCCWAKTAPELGLLSSSCNFAPAEDILASLATATGAGALVATWSLADADGGDLGTSICICNCNCNCNCNCICIYICICIW